MDMEQTVETLAPVDESNITATWADLPSLILIRIFDNLSKKDRQNASMVCKNWRGEYFFSRWWPKTEWVFQIRPDDLEKLTFLNDVFVVISAEIVIHSLSDECIHALKLLFEQLASNDKLRKLYITPAEFETIDTEQHELTEESRDELQHLLRACLPKLTSFRMKGIGYLPFDVDGLWDHLDDSLVTELELAAFMGKGVEYRQNRFQMDPLKKFNKLKVLRVDEVEICANFLELLDCATELERLVIFSQTYKPNYLPVPKNFWQRFEELHPKCKRDGVFYDKNYSLQLFRLMGFPGLSGVSLGFPSHLGPV